MARIYSRILVRADLRAGICKLIVVIRGLQGNVVYLGGPIAPSYTSPNEGGCGVGIVHGFSAMSTAVQCAHHVTWSPNKLWRSNFMFNLWQWSERRGEWLSIWLQVAIYLANLAGEVELWRWTGVEGVYRVKEMGGHGPPTLSKLGRKYHHWMYARKWPSPVF